MVRRLCGLLICIGTMAAGCAGTSGPAGVPAPHPSGCYVMVYEHEDFQGVGDVFDGPGRWSTLEGLARGRHTNWRNRIRSMRVGDAATVTVYTDRSFAGQSRTFASGTDHPRLDVTFTGRIESLEILCGRQPAASPPPNRTN